jgi:hypothetical protein
MYPMVTKKGKTTNLFFASSFLLLDPGSGMEKNQNSGSVVNIPDPQHCCYHLDSRC